VTGWVGSTTRSGYVDGDSENAAGAAAVTKFVIDPCRSLGPAVTLTYLRRFGKYALFIPNIEDVLDWITGEPYLKT
jgi:hypothetical protein